MNREAEIHPFHEAAIASYHRVADRAEATAHGVYCETRGRFPSGTQACRAELRKLLVLLDQVDKVASQLERIAELEEASQ